MIDENGTERQARFLDDTPCCEESAFQIHEEISRVIAREITNEPPDNIALIGNWGAGKSTVVERVKCLLKEHASSALDGSTPEKTPYVYFVFDAWAHSGDSLRRSFLDMLLAEIDSESDLSEDVVKDQRDKIYGKVSSSTTQENASFAPVVAAGIAAIASYGVSEGFLRGALPFVRHCAVAWGYIEASEHTGFSYWIDAISMLLAILAFLFMLLAHRFSTAGRERVKKRKKAREDIKREGKRACNDFKSQLDRFCGYVTAIFSKKADVTTTLVKQDNSPVLDSVEFEKLFQEILGLTDKTVIIVFDNLDRLSKSALREAWGTLQIFANSAESGGAVTSHENRPWILLPVSLEVFQAIENYAPKTEALSISKTFIRSFEIPAPIVTDWKGYFLRLASQAFPNTDEPTLLNVYAIASHSLLRVESRTPRNAKRFINSMVSQSLVFPGINLVSIAAFCYAKDSYAIRAACVRDEYDDNPVTATFSDYVLDLISGVAPESQYLGFPAGHTAGLDRDLAMMTYGQFSPEKASEVYIVVQLTRLFNDEGQVDFARLVKNNFGAWELIAKEIEDMLRNKRSRTPKWVFPALMALDALDEEVQQTNSGEISRLAQILIGGIVSLKDSELQGCGVAIAKYIDSCSPAVVEGLIGTIINDLKTLTSNVNQAIDDESIVRGPAAYDVLKKYFDDCMLIMEKGYQYGNAIENRLKAEMPGIDFGETYGEFLSCALALTNDRAWIASRPPQTINEFSQLISLLMASTSVGDFHSSIINAANETSLLGEFKLNAEQLKEVVSVFSDIAVYEGGLSALDVNLWLLINVCNLEAESVKDLFRAFNSSLKQLASYVENGDVYKQAAALALVLEFHCDDEYDQIDVAFVDDLCNAEVVAFLEEHEIDLIPQIFAILSLDESILKETCTKLLSRLWQPDDYGKRKKEDVFKLISIKNATAQRKEHGRLFAENGRIGELIENGFNIQWISVYCGALEGLEGRKQDKRIFSDWIAANLTVMSVQGWRDAVRLKMFSSLIAVMSKTTQQVRLPSLDEALGIEIIKWHGDSVTQKIIAMIEVYKCNVNYLAECLTNYIIHSETLISIYVQKYGKLLSRCEWLHSLTPEQRYFATISIIKTRRTYDCEWLYAELSLERNPKSLYKGVLKKVRSFVVGQLNLETMKKRKGAKSACEGILELLK